MDKKEIVKKILSYKSKIYQIDKWLSDNDWKVNKIVVGEWQRDDLRWIKYLSERDEKRKLRDELLEKIKELEILIKTNKEIEG